MGNHSIFKGNLVTAKGSTWRFNVYGDDITNAEAALLRWSYGTPFTDDGVEAPRLPDTWLDAGSGWVSQPITFTIAAPYIVRLAFAREPAEIAPFEPGSEPCEEAGVAEHLGLPADIAEAEDEDAAIYTVVYPGAIRIDDGPAFIAKKTEGFLPFKFTINGMGPRVTLHERLPLTPRIVIPEAGTLRYATGKYTRNESGIDDPRTEQENGQGPSYNVYIDPAFIDLAFADLGRNSPAMIRRDTITVDLEAIARPEREPHMFAAITSDLYSGVKFYIDSRPELIHFEDPGTPPRTYSMTKAAFGGRGRRQLRETNAFTTNFAPSDGRYLDGSGEFARLTDRSPGDRGSVELVAHIRDTTGIWWSGYSEGRVVGARRGNAGVVYYKLRTNDLPAVLRGQKLCVVRRSLGGRLQADLFARALRNAVVSISGLVEPEASEFDYQGVISSVLAGAAAVAAVVSTPWGVGLALGSALFGILWAHTPSRPLHPETAGQVLVVNTFLVNHPEEPIQRVPAVEAIRPKVRDGNTGGETTLNVSDSLSSYAQVGDLVRIEQTYLVSTFQAVDEDHETRSYIRKRFLDRALTIGANA